MRGEVEELSSGARAYGSRLGRSVTGKRHLLLDQKSSSLRPDCLTVRVGLPARRNLACEPFWPTRTNPCRRSILATSSDDGRLGTLQNQAVDVGVLDRGSVLGRRVLEVELQRLAEIGDRLLLGVTLAGHVDVEAPRDEPVSSW